MLNEPTNVPSLFVSLLLLFSHERPEMTCNSAICFAKKKKKKKRIFFFFFLHFCIFVAVVVIVVRVCVRACAPLFFETK